MQRWGSDGTICALVEERAAPLPGEVQLSQAWAKWVKGSRTRGSPRPDLPRGPCFLPQLEALNQSINIEQSQSDRSKRPFNPVT